MNMSLGPQRIVCLTEETTEWLYELGQEHKIVGFSDLQADIAAALIRQGIQVTVFNQRSVAEIFSMLYQVAAMVGQESLGLQKIAQMQAQIQTIKNQVQALTDAGAKRPKVFFEEWDVPHISAIAWVSELLGIAGGDDCFPELAKEPLGKNRIIANSQTIIDRNPDIIIGSWCGKKFRPDHVAARQGWQEVAAVKNQQLFEVKSSYILQPGPAALTDGLQQLHAIVSGWMKNKLI